MHKRHNIYRKALLTLLCSWGLCLSLIAGESLDDYGNAYYWHYRNLDSTAYYAHKMIASGHPAIGLNDLAFVDIMRMEYGKAEDKLQKVYSSSENQVELLIADVQMMRICQRRSMNKEYYDYQSAARARMARIHEEDGRLSYLLTKRLAYGESEFYIVNSTYYYYVGLQEKSNEALKHINSEELIQLDSAQTANYLYNAGADGDEYALQRSLYIAEQQGLTFFIANCLQAMAEQRIDIGLAQQSLKLFKEYGDVYQIAGAYRTLANCYIHYGEYALALDNLKNALNNNPRIDYAPDLLASIHERLSVVYAALGNMEESLYNRQEYLSLQEGKRQDRFLENRMAALQKELGIQMAWIGGVVASIILLLLMLMLFFKMRKRVQKKDEEEQRKEIERLQTQYEEQQERLNVARQKYVDNQRQNIENRAKVSFLNSLIPLIDRMVYTVKKKDVLSPNDVQYIKELTDDIDHKNALLTQWIQLRRGELNIKVETFPLQPLFEMLKRSKTAFSMKGITLEIEDTDYAVKADRILTLFMLNTLLDNASKFTPKGGRIVVNATQREEHVEVSVSDTGCGMDEEQLKRLFTANATISAASADQHLATAGHGFGLINCRGIIEKYRKVSRIFKDVLISAESRKGEGSRFFFRLPKGIVRMILLILSLNLTMTTVKAESLNDSAIAALTNRDFEAYDYFNNEYINELKENSIDRNLPSYCRTLQEGKTNRTVAVVLLVMILLSIVPLYYLLVWRFVKTNKRKQSDFNNRINRLQTDIELLKDECRQVEMDYSALYVSKNVLDNCLSTLKHETMYYPSHIANSLDEYRDEGVPTKEVEELITYYRDLYLLLTSQAMREVRKMRISLKQVDMFGESVKGDKVMMEYLCSMLGEGIVEHSSKDGYVEFVFDCTLTEVNYLVCRQIIRDHAEATNMRACGIERQENKIKIKLPGYERL